MTPRAQRRIDAFYDWETRGRGHHLFECPVRLEPPFAPFEIASLAEPFVDDGSFETVGSRLEQFLSFAFSSRKKNDQAQLPEVQSEEECGPLVDDCREPLTAVTLVLPHEAKVTTEQSEQLLLSLTQCRYPISFEVTGTARETSVQFCARASDAQAIQTQLGAFFPELALTDARHKLESIWADSTTSLIFELGLSREFMIPIHSVSSLTHDPLVGVVGALDSLLEGESGLLQILFEPLRNSWPKTILQALTNGDGSCIFSNASDLLSQTRSKTSKPLYGVSCRIGALSDDYDRVLEIATALAGALTVVNDPTGNELIPLKNDSYDIASHTDDLVNRRSRRTGMILNLAELVTLVHPPNSTVRSPKLIREVGRTKRAPSITTGEGVLIGNNEHSGHCVPVSLTEKHRVRHTHIIGSSGSGKSTLLINLIRQDIEQGAGLGVFDPHGDLIDQIMGMIPEERLKDVILFDPSDSEFPIGLNILSAHSELERNLLASDLVSVFRRLSTSWGDQMTAVLRNGILAMLENSTGGTLFDLRRFFVEPPFRDQFLKNVADPEVIYFWKKEFPMLAGRPQAPLLTRLNTFLGPKVIRNMVAQRENRIDFANIMDSGKIFLAKLSQGTLGEENSYLLGSLLVAKFYQLVMSSQAIEASRRRPFWLYIDEFHHFVCSSMSSILTGARKYRLGLTLAHQELKQIEHRDSNVAGAVLANPYSRICFRLGDEDARKLASGFSFFENRDLQNLGVGEAICRVERADFDFNVTVPRPTPISDEIASRRQQSIRDLTRSQYGTPRALVEAEILRSIDFDIAEAPREKTRKSPSAEHRKQTVEREDVAIPTRTPSKPELTKKPVESPPNHEALKDEFQEVGEQHDYTVSREVPVLGGKGRIDLVFERGTQKIACEIGNTTSVDHEAANIRKCSNAGFQHIVMVAFNRNRLGKIRAAVGTSVDSETTVDYLLPEEFIESLAQWAKTDPDSGDTERAKLKKTKVDISSGKLTDEERRNKEKEMLDKLKEAMRKKKP